MGTITRGAVLCWHIYLLLALLHDQDACLPACITSVDCQMF